MMERTNEKWKANTATGFVRAEDKSPIAAVYGERDEVSGNFIPDDLMASRAILISAAPDLLEALKMAQFWLDTDGRYDMQGINAAIAKATGAA